MTDALVDAAWLRQHLDDVLVLDATVTRTGDPQRPYGSGLADFETGHVPGSGFADLIDELSDPAAPFPFTRPSAEAFAAAAGRLGIDSSTHVVVHDRLSGAWAARVWWLLRSFGHERVSVLDGGLAAWTAAGGTLETGPPAAREPAIFEAHDHPELVATTEDVLALSSGPLAASVVCALRETEYSGESSDDPRRGHVPGSISAPYLGFLADDGTFDREASRRIADRLRETSPDGVVLYCGGGINAAGAALGLHVAGLDDVRLYDGSMSAWRADPALPLEVGPAEE